MSIPTGHGGSALQKLGISLFKKLPTATAWTAAIRLFGMRYVPLLAATKPKVVELTEDSCELMLPLRRKTRNHVGSMYFGALTIGADCAGGVLAMYQCMNSSTQLTPLFKDLHVDFLRRAHDDVYFICTDGPIIRAAVKQASESGQRVNQTVTIRAYEGKQRDDVAAVFTLTLSLKKPSSTLAIEEH